MTFAVSLYGWVLSLHMLSAFALVGGLVLFAITLVSARRIASPDAALTLGRISGIGTIALRAGLVGTLVFGIWLVFLVTRYSLANGWIIAALVLWVIAGALGDRSVVLFRKATSLAGGPGPDGGEGASVELTRALRGGSLLGFRLGALATAIAILVLMIWKPGA